MSEKSWHREQAWLGYAGLLPFAACTALLVAPVDPAWQAVAAETLRHYAAVIASFLGAVHWGVAAKGDDHLALARLRWGVAPALLSWVLMAIAVQAVALIGFAALFVMILIVDRHLLPILDDAYRRLRLRLSVVVVTLLLAAAAASAGSAV